MVGFGTRNRRNFMRQPITQPRFSRDPGPAARTAPRVSVGYLWSRTGMLKEIVDLIRAVEEWPGVSIASDRAGLSFAAGGAVIGHLRWDGTLDLPFTPVIRDQLVAEDMAAPDHAQ